MSLHKLTAGEGYTYLTRQVAALDATERGHAGLGDYYAQRGESPGTRAGSGLAGLAGVDAGQPVREEQMTALFGQGRHPDADRLEKEALAAGRTPAGAGHRPGPAPPARSACRSRATPSRRMGSGRGARSGSPPSTPPAAGRRTHRCRRRSGPGSAARRRGTCSPTRTGARRPTPGSCRGSSHGRRGRRSARWPAGT
ncbi:relaxase domain-containing protein [Geodermatophilus nigrescens]